MRRHLGQRPHRGDDIDDLEFCLPATVNGLLARDHHHRHRAQKRIGGAGGEVERAGPERGQAHPGAAGQPAIGRRHEAGGLFVAGDHELDLRAAQRIQHIEVFFAGNSEDVFDTFALERPNQQI